MFEGRYSLAVSPEGGVTLPPAIRKELHKQWGRAPALLCFGVQSLYLCLDSRAEALLRRLDTQLCAAFPEDMHLVNDYYRAMMQSVTELRPSESGRFTLPPRQREMLGVPRGGLLTLLGAENHLEIWNRERLDIQVRALERGAPGRGRELLETPICLQDGDFPCSLLRGGVPDPKRCGPCVFLRLP